MNLVIEKSRDYGESSVTVVGITRAMYGRPQYFLVNSDSGDNRRLKFPGLRFNAPLSEQQTLEDAARDRFEEQTGLTIDKMLGLRAIVPTRSRHNNQWMFRNVFLAIVNNVHMSSADGKREVYVADVGQGAFPKEEYVPLLGNSKRKVPLHWVKTDNQVIARIATEMINHFNWEAQSTEWYQRIPCVGAPPQTRRIKRPLGCGLAVASMMLLYQPNEDESRKIILLKRKGDKYPGYAGGKIETPKSSKSYNIDPVSCCMKEGAEEFGFSIQPRALVCCAVTPLDVPRNDAGRFYNCIINYAFVAEPTNPLEVENALKNPKKHLEGKMESYVVESLDEHRDRILAKELRMPDMPLVGEQFFKTPPGVMVPLNHIIASGLK